MEMVTPDREAGLARRIHQRDQIAPKKLTKANLRFVVPVAKKYQNCGMTLGDLINEGNLGLIKAAKKFDQMRGFKFISCAVWWIRQSIIQSLTDHSRMVRLPINKVNELNKIQKAISVLEQQFECDPTDEELAGITGITSAMVSQNQRYVAWHRSLDTPSTDDLGTTLLDVLPDPGGETPDFSMLQQSLATELLRMLSKLNFREKDVVVYFFGLDGQEPLTLEALSERLSITQERVRQIKEKAIRRLRLLQDSESLKIYL
ncbi:RNA polymerase sigma factor RpoD/SigA [Ravibacter arvi]|uniref:RNA polymerase sigma factor RpoD/SigA n=2 Tax=Ravibacter arvi TaxID=2051041 RepID=A0ABP8M8B8_9BACT